MYYKILNKKFKHNGFKYKIGLNTDTIPFNDNPNYDCVPGGLYFAGADNIHYFTSYGDYICRVIPHGDVIKLEGMKSRSHVLEVLDPRPLNELSTWEWMYNEGINIDISTALNKIDKGDALSVVKFFNIKRKEFIESALGYFDEYLHVSYARKLVDFAVDNENLDAVKYIFKDVDVSQVALYSSLRTTCYMGNLEIFKYLYSLKTTHQDTNEYELDFLQFALSHGHIQLASYILNLGLDMKENLRFEISDILMDDRSFKVKFNILRLRLLRFFKRNKR